MKTAAARALSFHPVAAVSVSLLMAILLVNRAVLARAQDAPPSVDLSEFRAFGSGCSLADTLAVFSSDNKSVTILFSKLRAVIPGTEKDKHSFCEVVFRVKFPPGWSYSIGTITARGFANLDDGVRATHHLSASISGTGKTARTRYDINGKYEDNYEFTRKFTVEVNSECDDDRHLNIENELSVHGPTGTGGIITVDSIDNKVEVVYPFVWKKC